MKMLFYLFYILPTGILYFILVDLLDLRLSVLHVLVLIFDKNIDVRHIKQFEHRFASKMGITLRLIIIFWCIVVDIVQK